jgi:hypothetical protein
MSPTATVPSQNRTVTVLVHSEHTVQRTFNIQLEPLPHNRTASYRDNCLVWETFKFVPMAVYQELRRTFGLAEFMLI